MTSDTILFEGCTPTPLSSYLKALGIFRLIANPSNHVRESAADSRVRCWWAEDHLCFQSRLNHENLLRFFLEDYAPSPIIAPWNGGSGFYPNDNKSAFDLLSNQDDIAERFSPIRKAIEIAEKEIEKLELTERPTDTVKARLISVLRSKYPESALNWIDAVLAFSRGRLSFPPLLGTGGNDGRLDFTNNFMQRLVSVETGLFDVRTGKPFPNTKRLLRTSLFGDMSQGLYRVSIGQFHPGSAGGPNATSAAYEGDASVNPWDFIFALEGSIMFAGAATRRHQSATDSGASFPFMVKTVGAGHGGISSVDEEASRAEFWAPLWNQPASYRELAALLKEGRAVLNGKTARDGLDFARAAASLGTSRGVECFERYGFVMRSGKAYLAVPLGKRKVSSEVTDAAKLINDLDYRGWFDNVRRFARKNNSSSHGRQILKQLEDSLFEMTKTDVSPRSVQSTLAILGDLVLWLAKSGGSLDEKPPPPPRLSSEWVLKANDGTYEYRVASALASLGWQTGTGSETDSSIEKTFPDSDQQSLEKTAESESKNALDPRMAMAAHFAPVDPSSIPRKFRFWNTQSNEKLTVFTSGNLISGLIAVLERRLVEQAVKGLKEKPLCAVTYVNSSDISAFLSPGFNHMFCVRLLSGLVWARPTGYLEPDSKKAEQLFPPFPYAILKPIFTPNSILEESGILPPETNLPIPPGLLAQLRSNRIDNAVRIALARMRASGVGSYFPAEQVSRRISRFGAGIDGRLLAASFLIPLHKRDLKYVAERAYTTEETKNM